MGLHKGPGHKIANVLGPDRCHMNCGGNWKRRRMVKPRAEGQKLDMSFSWTEVKYAQHSSHLSTLEDTGIWETWWHSWDPQVEAVNASVDWGRGHLGPIEGT